ncbi:amino acid/amide ABC transporter substrate-binding protein (HAAT family) [Halanaerobium saccharolyticum]|jgi:ABC-type branched-subunit amino acid transport system substrate-binding protein|uniref:Amino acid/amide ABC transporter substrate-binding protein (HAAT family) n=1 Tax=Halanaerobium saccharolyticum TaxID=43595 RepID=A0A2T5RJQ9_9FIRM|nr:MULTISPECIES: ABC transporter substrate-binding protein [Halanaerobium]PTV98918.1 amino acid/amide ABC transporter substrate-binding protein (HAAT family) [Halanaerobium saccharolyticum]PUU89434.1 MAG: braC [Halanaerobium sp.]TDP89026.1 amino acid/amide ABC transporter substrate-binding protein (HAAT family) [Halanaerobium saccharolyticum]
MFKKKILITMLLMLFLSLTVSGALAQETVKIGTLMPLTGGLASYGQFTRNGTLLAQKIINEQGGLLGGRELELVNVDTQTNPQAGVDGAQKLVSVNGINAIVGALSSGVTIPVAESVTVPGEVVLISPASTSPVLTNLDDDGFVFRTVPSDSLQGVVAGNLAADLNHDSLAVIYVNNDYGQGLNDAVVEQFEERGGEVTASIAFEPNKVSYRSELMEAAEDNPDALLLIAYTDDGGITIIRQALENGFFDEFIFTDGLKAPEITEGVEQYLEGMRGTAPTSMPGGEGPELFTELYEEEFGEIPPKPYIDTSFDATFVLALAIEKAGSTEGPAIRDAINEVLAEDGMVVNINEWNKAKDLIEAGEKIRYEGASGPVLFNDVGDSMGAIGIWKIEDGDIVNESVEVQ